MPAFTIKQIFLDNWNDFLNDNSDISIRPIIFEEINKIMTVVTLITVMLYMFVTIVVNFSKFLLGVNLDFVILVVSNILKIELYPCLKNLFVANIDISSLLCPINYGISFENTDIF